MIAVARYASSGCARGAVDEDRHAGTTDHGEISGSVRRRYRAAVFRKFSTRLDNTVPAESDAHLICANY